MKFTITIPAGSTSRQYILVKNIEGSFPAQRIIKEIYITIPDDTSATTFTFDIQNEDNMQIFSKTSLNKYSFNVLRDVTNEVVLKPDFTIGMKSDVGPTSDMNITIGLEFYY